MKEIVTGALTSFAYTEGVTYPIRDIAAFGTLGRAVYQVFADHKDRPLSSTSVYAKISGYENGIALTVVRQLLHRLDTVGLLIKCGEEKSPLGRMEGTYRINAKARPPLPTGRERTTFNASST